MASHPKQSLQGTGREPPLDPVTKDGVTDYGHCAYRHQHVATITTKETEPNWLALEQAITLVHEPSDETFSWLANNRGDSINLWTDKARICQVIAVSLTQDTIMGAVWAVYSLYVAPAHARKHNATVRNELKRAIG